MDADGGNQQRLTNNRHDDRDPSWSPDGKRIAFVSERDGNREIYVMNADGGKPKNLTKNPLDDRYPSWSPDGKRIAFTSERDDDREIYVMDVDGGNPQNLTNNPLDDWYPSWSPDGERIAFTSGSNWNIPGGNEDIYVIDAKVMVRINKDSLKIARMTGIRHGLPTVNVLPLRLIGGATL